MRQVEVVNHVLERDDGADVGLVASRQVRVLRRVIKEGYGSERLHGSLRRVLHTQKLVDVHRLELHLRYPQVEHVLLRQQIRLSREHRELSHRVLIECIDLGADAEAPQVVSREHLVALALMQPLGIFRNLLGFLRVLASMVIHTLLIALYTHLHTLDLFLQLVNVSFVKFDLVAEEALLLLECHRKHIAFILNARDVLTSALVLTQTRIPGRTDTEFIEEVLLDPVGLVSCVLEVTHCLTVTCGILKLQLGLHLLQRKSARVHVCVQLFELAIKQVLVTSQLTTLLRQSTALKFKVL